MPPKSFAAATKPLFTATQTMYFNVVAVADRLALPRKPPIQQLSLQQEAIMSVAIHDELDPDHRIAKGSGNGPIVGDEKNGYFRIWKPQGVEEDNAFWLMFMPLPKGMQFLKSLGRTETIATEGAATVLGKYPDYINLASELGAKRFNIPTNIWNKMSAAEQWGANTKFLDRMMLRGDKIILSNPVLDITKVSGTFRKELDYIIRKGYRFNSNGTQLIK